MNWMKKGNIFSPCDYGLKTHAQVPTVYVKDSVINVYFSSRNDNGKSLMYRAAFDADSPEKLLEFDEKPVMSLGKPGTFDDDGVMPSYIIEREEQVWMYYSGWNQRVTVPYHNSMGLAVSNDGGKSFSRMFNGPIMERTRSEPYLAVTPSVLFADGLWKMWYVSGVEWKDINGYYEPIYVIKYAESKDGIDWERYPQICIEPTHPEEAFSHPNVTYNNGIYEMWYCYRGSRDFRDGTNSYKMGYATSIDGIKWERKDQQCVLETSDSGWDSSMICYPYIFFVQNKKYMLYNGNGFGKTGFGLAEWSN